MTHYHLPHFSFGKIILKNHMIPIRFCQVRDIYNPNPQRIVYIIWGKTAGLQNISDVTWSKTKMIYFIMSEKKGFLKWSSLFLKYS